MSVETTWEDKTWVVKQRRWQHTLLDPAMATARRRRCVSSRCEGTGAPVSATHPRARRCWCRARPPRAGPAPTPPPAPSSRPVRDRVIEFGKHTGQCWARCRCRSLVGSWPSSTIGAPRRVGLALSESSTTLDRVECEARSCEVELDEGRASKEDDSINGDARNVNKGHRMVETNNVVTFRY